MFYIYHDFVEDNYLLFETVNGMTAFLYHQTDQDCWIAWHELLTAVPIEDTHPERYASWKKGIPDCFTLIYSARTLTAIHKFILDHPELAI